LREEIEKYPSTVGFEPGILALTASTLTTFAEMSSEADQTRGHQSEWQRDGETQKNSKSARRGIVTGQAVCSKRARKSVPEPMSSWV